MTTERESFDVAERGSSSATSEFAVQAWDSSNWRGNNPRSDESKLTFIDMGDNDIYNSRQGNRELNDGKSDLLRAENRISRVVDRLLDGNYDTNKLLKDLQKSDDSLDGASGDYKNAIKHLGASATTENLDDMVDGRRDVRDADKKVEQAIKQLKNGDERGAIKSLLQSLGEIDSAQRNFSDSRTGEDERHVHDHMYRDEDRVHAGGSPNFNEMTGRYENGSSINQGQDLWGTGEGYRAREHYNNDHGHARTDSGMWSGGNFDQAHRVADPLGLFPKPSDLKDPNKVIKKALDPLGRFG